MKNRIFFCIFLFFAAALTGCSDPSQLPADAQNQFNAEAYFTNEVRELQAAGTGIEKLFYKDQAVEEIRSDSVDWQAELQPFFEIKLNKPALINSFVIDSLVEENKTIITYVAKDKSVKLKHLTLYLSGAAPDSIIAVLKTSNLYYDSADTLAYFGKGNYRIKAWNKPRIGKEVAFVLIGTALPK